MDQDSSTILNECRRDASKRRPSLAQKMTSNLRRLSGATELKIDINDSISANNSKYCNKKIKVSECVFGSDWCRFRGCVRVLLKMDKNKEWESDVEKVVMCSVN